MDTQNLTNYVKNICFNKFVDNCIDKENNYNLYFCKRDL